MAGAVPRSVDRPPPVPAPSPAGWPAFERVPMSEPRRPRDRYRRLLLRLKHVKLPVSDHFRHIKTAISYADPNCRFDRWLRGRAENGIKRCSKGPGCGVPSAKVSRCRLREEAGIHHWLYAGH